MTRALIMTTILASLANFAAAATTTHATSKGARVPWPNHPAAVPLVTHNPYFSIWSMADRLTDEWPKHWTGAAHALFCVVRVDGKPYRILGPAPSSQLQVAAMEQDDLAVLPTQTVAGFTRAGVQVAIRFSAPMIPTDLDALTRPLTYIGVSVQSTDGKEHDVQVYFDACAEIAVHSTDQQVALERVETPGLSTLRTGTVDQPLLKRKGDATRIDWGHLYLSTSDKHQPQSAVGNADAV